MNKRTQSVLFAIGLITALFTGIAFGSALTEQTISVFNRLFG